MYLPASRPSSPWRRRESPRGRPRSRVGQLLREHKVAAKWSQPADFVFAGRIREKPRERNSVRARILHSAIEKANDLLAAEDRPPMPDGLTFHSLRRTYAALRAELGEHPGSRPRSWGTAPRV